MELVKPEIGLVFWMLLAFLLLLFILRKFAWTPIMNMLHQREDSIDEALNMANKAREEMKMEIEKYKFKKIDKSRREQRKSKNEIII